MSTSTLLEYGGLLLRVECTDSATLTWLEEFLSPAFNFRDTGSAACSVEIIADEGVYHATAQRGPQRNGERAACFAFDHGPIHLPRWTADGEERCLWDEVAKVFYSFDANHTHVRVLIDRHRPSRRIGLTTVVQVQAPTFTLFPGLRERLLPEWDHRLALRERSASVGFPEPGQAHQLTPAQFCGLVDTPMRGWARGNVVLFPRLDESCDGMALEPVSSTVAASRLREHLLGGAHPALSEVFSLSPASIDAQTLDRICREIATRARCFDCRLGRNAYQSALSLAVLDRLGATGATHE